MYNHTNKEYRILDFEKIAILIYNFSLVCIAMSGFFNIPEVINASKNFLYFNFWKNSCILEVTECDNVVL